MSLPSTDSSQPPPPTSVLFARGVIACLSIWPALRVAIDQQWGGPDSAKKRTWLASIIVDAFEEQVPTPDIYYVETTLLQVMEDEFDVVLEDGSSEEMAKNIVDLWRAAQEGSIETVVALETRADRFSSKNIQFEEAAGDNSDWEDESGGESAEGGEDQEAPTLLEPDKPPRPAPEVDEDGFITVKGKGRR